MKHKDIGYIEKQTALYEKPEEVKNWVNYYVKEFNKAKRRS